VKSKVESQKSEADDIELHALQLTVWDVPSAIGAGERFRLAVGVKCPAGCDLGGRELSLYDHEGASAATVKLGRETWQGTEALYFAEVEAKAAPEAGSHQWQVRIAGLDAELPHAACSCPVTVRVVDAADCVVTVKAVDRETQAPIQGARVVMHPYRAVTGDDGIAKVSVARGQYDILVSGSQHFAASTSVEVTGDFTTCAELDSDQVDEFIE
jgi:hypothetical protein